MPRFGFIGGAYTVQSPTLAAEECINWHPQVTESEGKSKASLMPSPGLSTFATIPGETKIRGMLQYFGPGATPERCFVAGAFFSEIISTGSVFTYGALAVDANPVSMDAGPNQLLIASGGQLYWFNLQTNVLTPINDPAGVLQVAASDTFGIALLQNSNILRISKVADFSNWPPLQIIQPNVFPDNINGIIVDHRELWLFGQKSSAVYGDTGSVNIFDPIGGASLECGGSSAFGSCRMDNSIFWWDQDERGAAVARRAAGYSPQRISTHAVEFAVQNYPARATDAISFSFQSEGHTFWQTYFPSGKTTWRYDVASGLWHKALYWSNGLFQPHLSQCHAYVFGKHLVGDRASGKVYDMSSQYNDDAGAPIRRMRRSPYISGEDEFISFNRFVFLMEQGLALQVGQGSAPIAFLKWTDDGGHTWSNEHQIPCGLVGQYRARAQKWRLGRARSRAIEFAVSDPIPWRLIDAYYNGSDAQEGASPRLGEKLRRSA
jgi:hypothetical protein